LKTIVLIAIVFLAGFIGNEASAEKEMTGFIKINDIYSTEPMPESYWYWFQEIDQYNLYRLNPSTVPENILEFAGKKVKITVSDDQAIPLTSSSSINQQLLDVVSIEKIELPKGVSALDVPTTWRSVTLLNKFSNVATIPSENPINFNDPQGIALDSSGNIYVVDSNSTSVDHRVQKFNSAGSFIEQIGDLCQMSTTAFCEDPDGGGPLELGDGEFLFPTGIAFDSSDNFYVVDNNNHRVQKFNSAGEFVLKFGANGGNGTSGSGEGEFNFPFGADVDSSGNVYVADYTNNRIQKFDSSGNFVSMFGWGVSDGSSAFQVCTSSCQIGSGGSGNGQFFGPRDVAIDSSDNIYTIESNGNRVQKFDSSMNFLLKFGSSGSGNGQFNLPKAIEVDDSNIYVADTGNNRVQTFNSTGTFLLKFGVGGTGDGQFDSPEGITSDASGNIYVTDKNNDRVQIFNSTGSLNFKIDTSPGTPHDVAYYQELFYDGNASVKQYYNASSYGKFTFDGNVYDWKTLSSTQVTYQNNLPLMLSDALSAHDSSVDFCNPSPVTNIILIFNGYILAPATNAAIGSVGTWEENKSFEGGGCTSTITVSWEPDNGGFFCCGQTLDKGIGVTAHELGHNIGLDHTPPPPGAWVGGNDDPYHDPNSVMSSNRDQESPSALITGQRDKVGWMTPGNKQTVSNGTSATITLDYINEPEGGANPQMIIVPLSNSSSYIIEAHKDELFNDTPQDRAGAIMYIHLPGGNNYSYLANAADKSAEYSLVATAGTDTESQFDEAILELNETYEDITNNITVTTQSIDATSITVFVSNNASTCTPPVGNDWIITESCTLTQNVTADKNIIVQNNSVLTIPNGFTVFFNPSTFNITVESGSGILIQSGGSIKTSP